MGDTVTNADVQQLAHGLAEVRDELATLARRVQPIIDERDRAIREAQHRREQLVAYQARVAVLAGSAGFGSFVLSVLLALHVL